MSAHHVAADCSQVFDGDATTTAHIPDEAEREALELLGYGGTGRLIRLSQREWRQVDRVVAAIKDARGTDNRGGTARG